MSSENKDADATEAEITESNATEIDATEADKVDLEKAADGDEAGRQPKSRRRTRNTGRTGQAALGSAIGRASWCSRCCWWDRPLAQRPSTGGSTARIKRPSASASLPPIPSTSRSSERQQQVAGAARDGTVALLSYAPETLDKDLANAKSHLTGEFLKYYSQFTDQIVAPAARQKGVKTEATVARAAVSELHADSAVVLVFVNQVTTSKDRPDPALATSSVVVKLTNTDGRWLISEFNPV